MTTAPLYVHRPLLNGGEVVRWFATQGLASTLAPNEMHVTVVYSKRAMDWNRVPPVTDVLVMEPMRGARGTGRYGVDRQVERLGEHGVMALCIAPQNSGVQRLIARWREYLAAGASHDFDGFKAHVAISYAGKDVDPAKVKPFPGELRFGPEVRGPIKENWKPDMSKEVPAAKAYARSATFSPSPCACGGPHSAPDREIGHPGGSMTTATDTTAAASPKAAGFIQAFIAKTWGSMSPKDRTDLLASAAVDSTLALGKAVNLLGEGDDHVHSEHVTDLFDGPGDDHADTVRAHGPDSSAAPGKVPVGPPQDASGGGAARMEGEYSRHAGGQNATQRATERLGAAIAGHTRAMKAFAAFGKAMSDRVNLIEMSLGGAAAPAAVDAKAIDAAVAAAVAKAIPDAVGKLVPAIVKAVMMVKAKGESESETENDKESGEEDEEEDEEAEQEESGSGVEIEIDNEVEDEAESDEDEGKKAARKAAARERGIAKGLLRLAKKASVDVADSIADGRFAAAARLHKCAGSRLAKARLHLAVAKALRPGRAAPAVAAIEKSIGAVAKAMKETRAKNQDKWPSHGKAAAAYVAEPATQGAAMPDAAKATVAELTEAVKAAHAGYALLTGKVEDVMRIVGGQSRDPAGGVSPVTELFKGGALDRRARIHKAFSDGEITASDRDKGIDALVYAEMPSMPATTVELAIAGCAPTVQAILRAAA